MTTRPAAFVALMVTIVGFFAAVLPVHAARELGPTRLGLPGLSSTIVAPDPRGAPVRFGLFYEAGTVDPTFGFTAPDSLGRSVSTSALRVQAAFYASRNVKIAGSLPLRRVSVEGGESYSGIGDVDVGLSAGWFTIGSARVGAWGRVRFPSGDEDKGLSTRNTEGEFGLLTSLMLFENQLVPEARLHLNVGYRINKGERFGYGLVDAADPDPSTTGVFAPLYPAVAEGASDNENDPLLLRAGVEFRRRWAHLFLEYAVDWFVNTDDVSFKESGSWFTPGVHLGYDDGPALKLAWSISLAADDLDTPFVPTLPDWYFQAGLSYPIFVGGRDSDGDTIPDDVDQCPDEPEDLDGYGDDDGCPDDDNDGDGVPDRYDEAPNLMEDFDGFQDDDGRPDLDNDLDGVPDLKDACPNVPEDFDGFEDEDGCPDVVLDADADGLEDADDRCPEAAEDMDGFEDGDGCPEIDNDLDGIVDEDDQCPNEREDYDGVEDDDGCPDPS